MVPVTISLNAHIEYAMRPVDQGGLGLSRKQAEEYAARQTDSSQQSALGYQKSLAQSGRVSRLGTKFSSAITQDIRYLYNSVSDFRAGRISLETLAKRFFYRWFMQQLAYSMIESIVSGDDPEKWLDRFAYDMTLGFAGRLNIIAGMVSYSVGQVLGVEGLFFPSTVFMDWTKDMFEYGPKRVGKAIEEQDAELAAAAMFDMLTRAAEGATGVPATRVTNAAKSLSEGQIGRAVIGRKPLEE